MTEQSIQMNLFEYFKDNDSFTIAEANEAVLQHYHRDVKVPSIRARIYEGLDKGLFKRVAKGVYTVTKKDKNGQESTCMLINGDGRDLSMFEDGSVDAIINDHPYALEKSHKGGNRMLVDYDCFQYNIDDFRERFRILRAGGFMIEMLPERNDDNIEYVNSVIRMAKECNFEKEYVEVNERTDSIIKSLLEGKENKNKKVGEVVKKEDGKLYVEIINEMPGFDFYSVVPWKKGSFVINQGRKAKNTEDVYFFTKGKARELKLDNKKNLALAKEHGIELFSKGSYDVATALKNNGLQPYYMSGTNGMLPVSFNHQPTSLKEKIHKAEKPIDLYNEIISFVTMPGEKVLDQFAGSGNLGVAAVRSGRDAILIEKYEETFFKMKANVEDSLGDSAVKEKDENTGLSGKNIVHNIFDAKTQVIVNPVNLVGVMGAGLAKEMKERYPEMFKKYKLACDKGMFKEGQLQLCKQSDVWILNFPTKRHWKEDSDIDLIEKGLQAFINTYEQKGITSITFPKLGCGLGGLDWDSQVSPLMHEYLDNLPIQIEVCGEMFCEERKVSLQEKIEKAGEKISLKEQTAPVVCEKEKDAVVH